MCPFARCDIRTTPCEHLDDYLEWGKTNRYFAPQVQTVRVKDIENFSEGLGNAGNTQGVWELFKKLKRLPLNRDQIRILIRKYGLKQGRRQIMRELKWNNNREFDQQFTAARVIVAREWKR